MYMMIWIVLILVHVHIGKNPPLIGIDSHGKMV